MKMPIWDGDINVVTRESEPDAVWDERPSLTQQYEYGRKGRIEVWNLFDPQDLGVETLIVAQHSNPPIDEARRILANARAAK